jgi:hypothetical protein
MPKKSTNASHVTRSNSFADTVERLALAACGRALWPNPYAADYHRAAVRRMIETMTGADMQAIIRHKRSKFR